MNSDSDDTPDLDAQVDPAEDARIEAYRDYARELSHNLRRARSRLGVSQEEIARAAHLAPYTYQKFEKGESGRGTPANPQLVTLLSLSQALETPLLELLPSEAPDMTVGR